MSGAAMRRMRPLLRAMGAATGSALLRASARWTRVRHIHAEREAEVLSAYHSVIYAFWHGRFWLLAACLRRSEAAVLVSLSEDGELIARVARGLGYHPVRGSSSRRGREGLRDLDMVLRDGRSAALTPDGPRGPRHRAQMGTLALAARTGKPILPLGAASRPAWTLGSWDAFQIPKPGAHGVIVYGEPLHVPAEGDLELWRERLEQRLTAVEAEADREVGR